MASSAAPEAAFLYDGQHSVGIPQDVTHVQVDPSVKVIGDRAFDRCTLLRSVKLYEGLEHIQRLAFAGCTSLESIAIPSTVQVVGEEAFRACKKLRSVKLCEGLERIEDGAFGGCTSLEVIDIPSTIQVVGEEAFHGCTKLRSVELCEGLERIDRGAFAGCTSLEQITIPSTVNFIGPEAFKNSRGLVFKFSSGMEKFLKEVSLREWLVADGLFCNLSVGIPSWFDAVFQCALKL